MTHAEFERQYRESLISGEKKLKELPKASAARYDAPSRRMVFDMESGATLLIPVDMVQGLQTDDEKALADFQLMALGTQIHWNELDTQFYVEDFLKGLFGNQKWMSMLREHMVEIGRKGGLAKTTAKRTASAANGKKGGRPRKQQIA